MMNIHSFLYVCFFAGLVASFSMKDVGITDDIHQIACSLNDIFKEAFELMTGSLGKHGVYYLPEIKHAYDSQHNSSEEKSHVEFLAFNGWMKYPVLKAAKDMRTGALRKYKVPLGHGMREILLVCVECLEVSAQSVNFCYEATCDGKNASGTMTNGPVIYTLSLEMRITQSLSINREEHIDQTCNVTMGERSFELSKESDFRSEVRGLRSLNFLADNIDGWVRGHFNSTVKAQLEKRLLTALDKVFAKHNVCDEFIGQ